jgi:hypothetical protein
VEIRDSTRNFHSAEAAAMAYVGVPVPMNLLLVAEGVSGPLSGVQRWSRQRSSGHHRL